MAANSLSEILVYGSVSQARTNLNAAASGSNADITALTGLTTPLSASEGGTGSATAAASYVLRGPIAGQPAVPSFGPLVLSDFPPIPASQTIGFAPVATSGSASDLSTGSLPIAQMPQIASNTALANATASTAAPTALAMPACSATTAALQWTTNTGFGCNSTINASTLNGANFAAPGNIGSTTASTGKFTSMTFSTTFTDNGTNYTNITGSTATLNDNFHTIDTNTGTLASLTLTTPASPGANDIVCFAASGTITSLTVSANTGQSLGAGTPTTMVAGNGFCLIWRASNTTWYRWL
jgi:hypothetical protein